MKSFFTTCLILLFTMASFFTGCVDNSVDSADSSGLSITIKSPSTNDSINYSGEKITYSVTQVSGLKFMQLYVNKDAAVHIPAPSNGSLPEITLSFDSTYIGSRISFYVIYYDQNGGFAVSDTIKNLLIVENHNPPHSPYDFKLLSLSETSVNLSWKDSSKGETGYEIFRRKQGESYSTSPYMAANAGTYNINDESVTKGITYFYKVRGKNIYGTSEFSAEINTQGSGGSSTVPAPGNLTVIASGPKVVKLTWTDNSSNENYFSIERKYSFSDFENIANVPRNSTSYTDSASGLTAGIEYTYRVKAYSGNDSSWSAEVTVTTPAYSLVTPAIASLTNTSSTSVLVKWKDNDNAHFTYINIYRKAAGEANYTLLGEAADYTKEFSDNTVIPNKLYYYKLLSTDGSYSSAFSEPVGITTGIVALNAPEFTLYYYGGSNKVYLGWKYDQEATKFIIERTNLTVTPAVPETFEVNGSLRSFNDNVTSACGNEYQYRIKAVDNYTSSDYSTAVNVSGGCW